MADYTQPEYVDRRLRYFDGQFLKEQDFIDEQRYHIDRERRLSRWLHTPGIVAGLEVTPVSNATRVKVGKGTALDGLGQQIVRTDDADPIDLSQFVNRDGPVTVLLAIAYAEEEADAPQGGASPRWREAPAIVRFLEGAKDAPPEDTHLRLARLTIGVDGTVTVDQSYVPARVGARLPGSLSVRGATTLLSDAAIGTAQAPARLTANGPLTVGGKTTLSADLSVGAPVSASITGATGNAYFKGSVVVGTTDPGKNKLRVAGSTYLDGSLTATGATTLNDSLSIQKAGTDANGGDLFLGSMDGSNLRLGHHSDYNWVQSHGGKPLAINPLGTNVGIGTTTPRSRLEVSAATDSGGSTLLRDPEAVLTLYRPGIPNQTWPNVAGFSISRYALEGTSARTRLDVGLSHGENTDTTPIMTWRSDGKVGIGTTEPWAGLDIKPTLTATAISQQLIGLSIAPTFNDNGKTRIEHYGLIVRGGKTILEQEQWTPVHTLANNWQNYSVVDSSYTDPAYFKDSQGIVHLRGLMQAGSFGTPTNPTAGNIFTLPPGYTPGTGTRLVFAVMSDGLSGRVDILGSGNVCIIGGRNWISLNGLSFRAE